MPWVVSLFDSPWNGCDVSKHILLVWYECKADVVKFKGYNEGFSSRWSRKGWVVMPKLARGKATRWSDSKHKGHISDDLTLNVQDWGKSNECISWNEANHKYSYIQIWTGSFFNHHFDSNHGEGQSDKYILGVCHFGIPKTRCVAKAIVCRKVAFTLRVVIMTYHWNMKIYRYSAQTC